MSESGSNDRAMLAARHLLGKLSVEEQRRVEEGLFAEEGWFEELRQAENDLIDAYAYGSLAPDDRKLVEERILVTAEQRERLQIAISLGKVFAERSAIAAIEIDSRAALPPGSWFLARGWLYGGMTAMLAAGIILAIMLVRSERQTTALRTELQTLTVANSAPPPPAATMPREAQPGRAILAPNPYAHEVETIFLPEGVRRGSEAPQAFAVDPQTQVVHLQLQVHPDNKAQKFEARILTPDRVSIWNSHGLSPQIQDGEAWVNLWVPVNALRGKEFEARVWQKSSSETESTSYFLLLSPRIAAGKVQKPD